MKVQLIVVQGRPEGKVIPLVGPKFKIGRGETCHLRPNSEQVSREHAEFSITGSVVAVSDLGSRNGTLVNGKAITEQCTLKDRDLVQVGPLTFAVSIQGAPAAITPAPASSPKAAPDDVNNDDIESWLIADSKNSAPERPSGVYGGDTITINAFKDAAANASAAAAPKAKAKPAPEPLPVEDSDDEYERQEDADAEADADADDSSAGQPKADADEIPEEFIDESNPFYVKKKAPEAPQAATKPEFKDTSDAASDILRKMMERRRNPK